jgi:hypothetical protein
MMPRFLFAMCALLIGLAWAPNLTAQNNSGIIEGIVTRQATTEGLAGVRITITREGQQELEYEPDAVTDAAGHFLIRNASPGPYTIRARRTGFIAPMQDGIELQDGGASKKIVVSLESPLNINLNLAPGAALAGRVLDPLGKPAENAAIQAILFASDGTSRTAGSATVDELGMFRVWGLPSGKYKLSVEFRPGRPVQMDGEVFFIGPDGGMVIQATLPTGVSDTWVKTYFPGTVDSSRAALVEVPEGGVVEGLNFGFQIAQSFKISGTVVDPGRSKRSGAPNYYLIPGEGRDGKVLDAPRTSQNSATGPSRQAGAFEIRGILPGRYILFTEDWTSGATSRENYVVAQTILDISSDLTNIALTMTPTSTIEGLVRTPDQQPARNARVVLIPAEEQRGHPMHYKEVKSDSSGKFTIYGVMPGDYKVYAVDPANFKESPPPTSLYSMPVFLDPFASQGAAVRAKAEERISVSLVPVRN